MAVDLDNVAERILAIDHAIRLLARVVMANLSHTQLSAVLLDTLDERLDVRILEAEMKDPGFPVFEIVLPADRVRELEELDADAVAGREMGNAERPPALAEHVVAHLTDGGLVVLDFGRTHNDVETETIGVEVDGFLEIRDRYADMRECNRARHSGLLHCK